MDIVRRVMRRISDGDLDAALGDVAPDAELDWSDSLAPDGGVYRGRAEWRAWFQGREEGLSELRFDATEVIDASSDTVLTVARLQARGRASGIEVGARGAALWKLRDGMVTALTLYQTRNEALRAVRLAD